MSDDIAEGAQIIAERISEAECEAREWRERLHVLREIMERHPCPDRDSFLWFVDKALGDSKEFARVAKHYVGS